MQITVASTPHQIAFARELFEEYAAGLGIDLSYQGFGAELAGLPGLYAPPRGRLLLALDNASAAGCVALRPLQTDACEMKRLFVRPAFRRSGLGRQLAKRAVEEARLIGYLVMRLDTLPHMEAPIRLYETLGFSRCDPYYQTPLRETVFMELRL